MLSELPFEIHLYVSVDREHGVFTASVADKWHGARRNRLGNHRQREALAKAWVSDVRLTGGQNVDPADAAHAIEALECAAFTLIEREQRGESIRNNSEDDGLAVYLVPQKRRRRLA